MKENKEKGERVDEAQEDIRQLRERFKEAFNHHQQVSFKDQFSNLNNLTYSNIIIIWRQKMREKEEKINMLETMNCHLSRELAVVKNMKCKYFNRSKLVKNKFLSINYKIII